MDKIRDQITAAAVEMANNVGVVNITRAALCERVGIPDGSFNHRYGGSFADLLDSLRVQGCPEYLLNQPRARTTPEARKTQLVDAGLTLANEIGFYRLTRCNVARRAGVTPSLVNLYFGSIDEYAGEVMAEAVRTRNLKIIAQGIAADHPTTRDIDPELRARAVGSI